MQRYIKKLKNYSLKEMILMLGSKLWYLLPSNKRETPLNKELQNVFSRFNTSNLKNVNANDFEKEIKSLIDKIDSGIEEYTNEELDWQRDLSIRYFWGHNHDFGTFKLNGLMGDRHIYLMENFIRFFPITGEYFNNKDVFDIGCWTGGTTLLLSGLGSNVLAIEEVKKYSNTVKYLAKAFGLENNVSTQATSLYECNTEDFHNRFDIAYFPGVIYHLSDPVLALRIIYNSLKISGVILIESAGINTSKSLCRFDGNYIYSKGKIEKKNRWGWNWFLPSPSALSRMMMEAGFDRVKTKWDYKTNRVYAYGEKIAQVGICKAGLSVPKIK